MSLTRCALTRSRPPSISVHRQRIRTSPARSMSRILRNRRFWYRSAITAPISGSPMVRSQRVSVVHSRINCTRRFVPVAVLYVEQRAVYVVPVHGLPPAVQGRLRSGHAARTAQHLPYMRRRVLWLVCVVCLCVCACPLCVDSFCHGAETD